MTHLDRGRFAILHEKTPEVAAEISRLCSRCFPWGMRWVRWSNHAGRWWSNALSVDGAECITIRDTSTQSICGFCLLIFDEQQFKNAIMSDKPGLVDTFVRLPYAPVASYHKRILRRSASAAANLIAESAPDRRKPRSWVEIVGVDPLCRGHGLGRKLLDDADRLSIEKHARSIEALTGSWNGAAMTLFSRCGYTLSAGSGQDILCSKSL